MLKEVRLQEMPCEGFRKFLGAVILIFQKQSNLAKTF